MTRDYSWTSTGRTKTAAQGHVGASEANASSGLNFLGSAVSGIGTIATTAMNLEATKMQQEARVKSTISAMDNVVSESILQSNISVEQMRAIDRTVGDMMTKTGLDAMKAEASARAGAAMTGTSGGTTETATEEAYMIEMLDNAAIVAQGRNERLTVMRRQQMADLSARNRLDSLASGLSSPEASGLSMLAAGISGFTSGYKMLPDSYREKFFAQED